MYACTVEMSPTNMAAILAGVIVGLVLLSLLVMVLVILVVYLNRRLELKKHRASLMQ